MTSSLEVVGACLRRIAAVNPALNAVVQLNAEAALVRAQAADAAAARGDWWGTLHGVPCTIKDWIETNDLICGRLCAAPGLRAADARRLWRGCVRRASSCWARPTPSRQRGFTRADPQPYNPGLQPGGQQQRRGRPIIAAGGSPVGLGSDSGGSIRQPAHNCGIAGLKADGGACRSRATTAHQRHE